MDPAAEGARGGGCGRSGSAVSALLALSRDSRGGHPQAPGGTRAAGEPLELVESPALTVHLTLSQSRRQGREPGLRSPVFELHWWTPMSSSFRKAAVGGGVLSLKDETLSVEAEQATVSAARWPRPARLFTEQVVAPGLTAAPWPKVPSPEGA